VLAPSDLARAPRYNSDTSYTYAQTGSGTSMAAPIVASALVSLLDWGVITGQAILDPGIINVMVLAMGDGDLGSATHSHVPRGPIDTYSGIDPLWGAGRFLFRLPSARGMDGPSGWGYSSLVMSPGATHFVRAGGGPLNSDVDSYVVAMSWDERNLDAAGGASAADILLRLVSTAPQSGSCPLSPQGAYTIHHSDLSYDVQKLIRARRAGLNSLRGRCVYAMIQYWGGSGSRVVYFTDMWEDLDRECSDRNLGGHFCSIGRGPAREASLRCRGA
jgi:hypothetical protein